MRVNAYRRLLGRTCFVGVTGSCGKTTTKNLIAATLGSHRRVRASDNFHNGPAEIATTVLSTRPWHRYCVAELGGFAPGILAETTSFFRPDVAVIIRVGSDHRTKFRSLDATAAEKGVLVEALRAGGTAILNADDPRVWAMRERTVGRVVSYGRSESADVRAEDVSSRWPQRLSLTVACEGERISVETRLLGEHWSEAVLAALATATALSIPLGAAARAVQEVPPAECRMSELETPDGVTFVLDTWKAPLWTVEACCRFLESARAARRVLVFGTISDYSGKGGRRYRAIARRALEVADLVLFVGDLANSARPGGRVHSFRTAYEASRFLERWLRPGDLVLLKGSQRADHLERLALAHKSEVSCWRHRCGRWENCRDCELRADAFVPAATKP
jgi:UDP-N-acetylmuramoyl-tripeptide--D-alanyl-D-alanine ligase